MNRYKCHEIVEATKVNAAEKTTARGSWQVAADDGKIYYLAGHHNITEADLGYVVKYNDDYMSWSPTKAFEEGYTLLDTTAPQRQERTND